MSIPANGSRSAVPSALQSLFKTQNSDLKINRVSFRLGVWIKTSGLVFQQVPIFSVAGTCQQLLDTHDKKLLKLLSVGNAN